MPSGEGRSFSFRVSSTIAQGVASYRPWQCGLTAKGTLTSQQEGGSAARKLLQLSRQADGTQERALTSRCPVVSIPSPLESEKPIHGEKTKEGERYRATCTPSLNPWF